MTREEAIKIVKEFVNGTCLHLVDQEALETLIPELAENDDERTRKDIINLIYWLKGNPSLCSQYYKDRYDGMLAWLEKQKEQKPDSLIYDKDLDKAAREFYLSGGADSPVDSTGLVPIVRMAEFGATWMKERMEKEQNPCWNPTEEDVALFNKAITTNASLSPQERAKLDIIRMKFKHRPVIEQKEQKPYEPKNWPADKDNLTQEQKPIDYDAELEKCKHNFLYFWDKYVTVKLKTAKWSKEDEEMLNLAIEWAEAMSSQCSFVDMDPTDFRKIATWLKFLRPQYHGDVTMTEAYKMGKEAGEASHWKPSDEQMRTLDIVISDYRHACTKGCDRKAEILKSLLEQLQKM